MGERSWSWAEIQAAHANTRTAAIVAMDTAAVAEVGQLIARHMRLRDEDATGLVGHSEEMTALKDRIQVLIRQAEASEVTFVFQGIGRSRYNKLRAEHPAPDGQAPDELYGAKPGWNVTTFPPALFAEACTEPAELAGNVQAWTEIHDTWSSGLIAALWKEAASAQAGVNQTPKYSAVSALLKGTSTETS